MKLFGNGLAHSALKILALAGLLAGCASNSVDGYYKADPLPPMKVPQGMETTSLEPLYVVPEVKAEEDELFMARNYGAYETPRPDPLPLGSEAASGVKIQSLGDERWILVDVSTSQIWPRVQAFLSRNAIRVAVNDPRQGLIETDWVGFKNAPGVKHRYRLWIEPGLRPETAEIHIVHREVPEAFGDAGLIDWNRSSDDAEREALLLDELAGALAANPTSRSASLLGQNVGGAVKADIEFVEAEPVLRLRLSYNRAWATVKHALDQEEFVLWEADVARRLGLFSYVFENPDEGNFLTRWFTADLPDEQPATLSEVIASLASEQEVTSLLGDISGAEFGDPRRLAHTYLVIFKAGAKETSVHVRATDGTRLSPREARKILSTIRRNLI